MKGAHMTIQQLKACAAASRNQEVIADLEQEKKGKRLPTQPCDQVLWMGSRLAWWSLHTGIEVKKEHRFHPTRKWRFDFAILAHKIGIEYDGLMSTKSRHTTLKGFTGDTEKMNEAQARGWRVLRFTCRNYKSVLREVEKLIEK